MSRDIDQDGETKITFRAVARSLPWDAILKFFGGAILTVGGWFLHLAWDEITAVKEEQSDQHDALIRLEEKQNSDRSNMTELKQLVKDMNVKLDRLMERQTAAKP